eukprot:6387737-Prymnesium_polylepis.1
MHTPRKKCESLPRVLDPDRSNPGGSTPIVGNTEPALSTRPQPIYLFDGAAGVVTEAQPMTVAAAGAQPSA